MSAERPIPRLRLERPGDRATLHALQAAAFGQEDEAELLAALRARGDLALSLVAEVEGGIAGHAVFSPVRLDGEAEGAGDLAALGPIAVWPERQGQGIGGALVREGLARGPALGWRAIFLVGGPWYGRFGFAPAGPRGFRYGEPHFDPALQVLELEPGALDGRRGLVRYAAAFGQAPPTAAPADGAGAGSAR